MNLEYDPWVYVEKVRPNGKIKADGQKKPGNIVAELAKYTVKDDDYLILWVDENGQKKHFSDMTDVNRKSELYWQMAKVVAVLDSALHKRRLAAFGGVMKQVHKMLNLDDPVNGDLNVTDEDPRAGMGYRYVHYDWKNGFGNYYLTRIDNAGGENVPRPPHRADVCLSPQPPAHRSFANAPSPL